MQPLSMKQEWKRLKPYTKDRERKAWDTRISPSEKKQTKMRRDETMMFQPKADGHHRGTNDFLLFFCQECNMFVVFFTADGIFSPNYCTYYAKNHIDAPLRRRRKDLAQDIKIDSKEDRDLAEYGVPLSPLRSPSSSSKVPGRRSRGSLPKQRRLSTRSATSLRPFAQSRRASLK